ncbi:MAG: toxin-antitoxin system YwqK family antitoxin [Flavobacteriales bacterium]|nr:toxin-antitoxin system YwqK family antitoxin [Flavobacteriales bacterium]
MRSVAAIPPFCLLLLSLSAASATAGQANAMQADTLNRMDEQGRKQGWWQVMAPVPDKPAYPTGALFEEGRYVDNRRSGTWKRYWPNGKAMSAVQYERGLPKGAYTLYYPNGRPEEQGVWNLDRNTGNFQRWYANGKRMQEFVFDEHGTRNGDQKYYHENGNLAVEVKVVEGREEGTLKRFTRAGELKETAEFNGGVMKEGSTRTYELKLQADKELPPADAVSAPAVPAGDKPNAAPFRANGWNTLYDAQYRLSQQGEYRQGRLWNGRVYSYDSNGILYRIDVYTNGRYVGKAPITDMEK